MVGLRGVFLTGQNVETEKSYEYLQEKLDNDEGAESTEVVKGGLEM